MSNRQIHAVTADNVAVTRYDRSGKWWAEGLTGHRRINLDEAVRLACLPGSRVLLGRPGGRSFDARVRKALADV